MEPIQKTHTDPMAEYRNDEDWVTINELAKLLYIIKFGYASDPTTLNEYRDASRIIKSIKSDAITNLKYTKGSLSEFIKMVGQVEITKSYCGLLQKERDILNTANEQLKEKLAKVEAQRDEANAKAYDFRNALVKIFQAADKALPE